MAPDPAPLLRRTPGFLLDQLVVGPWLPGLVSGAQTAGSAVE